MPLLMQCILKFVDFTKTQKSRYIDIVGNNPLSPPEKTKNES